MSEECGAAGCNSGESCGGDCGSCCGEDNLKKSLNQIKHKILVLSGKGGVGKSTVAVNLAVSLSLAGKKVGLLDVDFHGPSVPTMLNLQGELADSEDGKIVPVEIGDLKVMSVGLLLPDRDAAVIWRGPMKMGVIKQLLSDVTWGELDYLVIDSPPGTGDEPLSVCQLVEDADGAVIVTTPQEVALADVRRSISFCRQLELPVLGVIENMSGFACPKCGEITHIFKSEGGGALMAKEMKVPFLGCIPIDPEVARCGDEGKPYVHHYAESQAAKSFSEAIAPILAREDTSSCEPLLGQNKTTENKGGQGMIVAIPLAEGKLTLHFGHCAQFALVTINPETKEILGREDLTPPPHEPGVLPKWLAEKKANLIIAGGMGSRAQGLFAENGINVVTGAPSMTPEEVVTAYMDGTLVTGDNACDH